MAGRISILNEFLWESRSDEVMVAVGFIPRLAAANVMASRSDA
jgi:hypothetical protein